MEEIVKSGGDVNLVVTEISGSTKAQSTSINEISHAINSLDEMTQQNAALAEQTMAATQSLSEKSTRAKC